MRKSLGIKIIGDSTDSVWGVMDVYPLNNFPDIRKKVAIKSGVGSMLIVPREDGSFDSILNCPLAQRQGM